MAISVEAHHFGPIASGRVTLAPLSILIGPNNTGKSAMAMLVYAAMSSYVSPGLHAGGTRMPFPRVRSSFRSLTSIYGADCQPVLRDIENLPVSPDSDARRIFAELPPRVLTFLERRVAQGISTYGTSVIAELQRSFGSELRDLISQTSGEADPYIVIRHGSPRWVLKLRLAGRSKRVLVESAPSLTQALKRIAASPEWTNPKFVSLRRPDWFLEQLLEALFADTFSEFPSRAKYLPAARSGILQGHKAIASAVMHRAPLAGIEDMMIPRMSGVVTDFVSELLVLGRRRRRPFEGIAKQFTKELLNGEILVEQNGQTYPEISYVTGGAQYPLHRTSSMVSELAPVLLYLRHVLDRGSLLIIEEPESHLHPEYQLIFARMIVRLVNSGLNVLLTTHSDYFLRSINNSVRRATLDSSFDDSIAPSHVRAYLFRRRALSNLTRIQALRVTRDEGISEYEFGRVASALYNETAALDYRIEIQPA